MANDKNTNEGVAGRPDSTIVLRHPEDFPNPFEELESEAARHGVAVKRNAYRSAPQMGIADWLLPFIIIAVAGPFLGEMGKDFYRLFKEGVKALWAPVFGPTVPRAFIVRPSGVDRENRVPKLGIVVPTPNGTIKLVLYEGCRREEFTRACKHLFDIIEGESQGAYAFTIDGTDSGNYQDGQMVLTYDREQESLVIVQPKPKRPSNRSSKQEPK